ncbi:MAG TPA: hypothetical protein VF175_09760 [Lacipirellula sp.]
MNLSFRKSCLVPWALFAGLMGGGSPAGAITLGQLDDFQTGGVAGWGSPAGNTVTAVIPNAGPLGPGDSALNVEANLKLLVTSGSQWHGNYTAAGIVKISMDVQHSNGFPLELRLGIANGLFSISGSGDTYETIDAITVPNDGQWHRVTFDVMPTDFIDTFGNSIDPPDPAAALANVTHLRLFHNPASRQFVGEAVSGSFNLDNILAEGVATADDADFDDDGDVDGRDFLVWQRNLASGTQHDQGDADFNEVVDAADLEVWNEQFSAAVPPIAPIPEPTAAVLALMGAALLLRRPAARQ